MENKLHKTKNKQNRVSISLIPLISSKRTNNTGKQDYKCSYGLSNTEDSSYCNEFKSSIFWMRVGLQFGAVDNLMKTSPFDVQALAICLIVTSLRASANRCARWLVRSSLINIRLLEWCFKANRAA